MVGSFSLFSYSTVHAYILLLELPIALSSSNTIPLPQATAHVVMVQRELGEGYSREEALTVYSDQLEPVHGKF